MVKQKVFVDGVETAVGLTVWDLLWNRADIELSCYEPLVHDGHVSRIELARDADFVLLCGDVASSIELVKHLHISTRIIDTSGAYLAGTDVACGLPELFLENAALIHNARVVGIPNAVATASLALLHPLAEAGYLVQHAPISIHAILGYSAAATSGDRSEAGLANNGDRAFLRTLQTTSFDRVLLELTRWTRPPKSIQLITSIGNFPRGTAVHIPLFHSNLTPNHTVDNVYALLERWYLESCHVKVARIDGSAEGIAIRDVGGTNVLELFCMPGSSEESGLLAARLDNLGRGSSRAAVQVLNIMLDKTADFELDGCLPSECKR